MFWEASISRIRSASREVIPVKIRFILSGFCGKGEDMMNSLSQVQEK
jgi:hypothetical protein